MARRRGSSTSRRLTACAKSRAVCGTHSPPPPSRSKRSWSGLSLATTGMPRARYSTTLVGEPESKSVPRGRSEEHTSELQSQSNLVCRLLLEKKKKYTHDWVAGLDQLSSDPRLGIDLAPVVSVFPSPVGLAMVDR